MDSVTNILSRLAGTAPQRTAPQRQSAAPHSPARDANANMLFKLHDALSSNTAL